MTTEFDARADSHPEWYDPLPEPTTFPSGLNLADMVNMATERPRDSIPFAVNQTAPETGSKPALP